jgi:hypothetical protein
MYEFEKHPKLTEFVQEMASSGKAPQEWTSFIETLNQALRIHDVVGRSEQLCSCEHEDSLGKDETLDNLLALEKKLTMMFDSNVRVALALLDEIRKLNQNKDEQM